MEMGQNIQSVSDYLCTIKEAVQSSSSTNTVVFRGEPQIYSTHCQPNIFRKELIETNPYFEKNLFEEMTANHLTDGLTYLEKAIDAQHGGFPSRLLDVSYNCLTALYFAVTPFYHQDENSLDDTDGAVYVFSLENMYCPTGLSINDAYNACVLRDISWFCGQELFAKNHKLIDHIKKNPRIIAQQGAFILFQGDRLSPIPEERYKKIVIPHNYKAELRKELRLFFGIHTGSIYPEETNLVEEMIQKTERISTRPFSLSSEMDLALHGMTQFTEHALDALELADGAEYQALIQYAERVLFDYRIRFLQLGEIQDGKDVNEAINKGYNRYNEIVCSFADDAEMIMKASNSDPIEICRDELRIIVR